MADNKTIQKIFSLSDFRKKQLLDEVPQRTRESYREYGYFGGGYRNPGGTFSLVERIDYSNDTVTASRRGSISNVRRDLAATGNSNFGYFGAGVNGNSFIYRIDYANDSANGSARTTFVSTGNNRRFARATGNSNFGYFSGGSNTPSPRIFSTVDRLDYNNDTSQCLLRGSLSLTRVSHSGASNSNFGYFAGGNTPAAVSTVDRINYSNDLSSTGVRGPLSVARFNLAATGNSNFGYFAGGDTPGDGDSSIVERINYSNDLAAASPRGPLSLSRQITASAGNSNFGYFSVNSSTISTVDRFDYSNDTATASIRGSLTLLRIGFAGCSSASFGGSPNSSFASNFTFPTVPNAGYFGGGTDGTNNLATIDKVDYANDTSTASVRSALSVARYGHSATGNSSFGYFGGGVPEPGASNTSTIDRIEYASDTQNTVTGGPLSLARGNLTATGTSNFGYFGGGSISGGEFSTVDRIDYSNDSATTSVRGPLSIARFGLSSTGNQNFGYFGGGTIPGGSPTYSQIDRIDYSNDTSTASSKSNLTLGRFYLSATGTQNFGYFGGGSLSPSGSPSNWRSIINRIEYSNDTQTTVVRGPLNSPIKELSATGNSNFGYFGGGDGPISSVNRLDYSNDTAVTSIRGPLSTAKRSLAATSPLGYGGAPIYFTNPLPEVLQKQIEFDDSNTLDLPFKRVLGSFGYFGGGSTLPRTSSSATSRINRIDYSNDTATASVRGPLTLNRYQFSATGNSNFGYYIAGNISIPSVMTTTIDRVDYSNDGTTALLRGNITSGSAGRSFGATGNSNFGYIGNWPYVSTTNRIDYSNDNSTASIRGPLSSAKGYAVATGNQNFGYFGGGYSPGPTNWSKVDRIDYSNDLSRASVRGPLSLARHSIGSTGNTNFGYFGGGQFLPGVIYSTVDRIDYSNDTQTASVRGPLSFARQKIAATGNSNFGYFGGGSKEFLEPTNTVYSSVDRIDYSNDTSTASVRGPLSSARTYLAATTNARSS